MITLEMVLVPTFLVLVFFVGRVYQEVLYKLLRMQEDFFLVSSFRKEFTKAMLLKVLYIECLITLGFILGKCIFIIATTIL